MEGEQIANSEQTENPSRITLHSKLSIALTMILVSPYFAAYLYAKNLNKVQKNNKIFGAFAVIIVCNLIVLVGLLGFDLRFHEFHYHLIISRSVTALLTLTTMWDKHFNHKQYIQKFPFKLFFILLGVQVLLTSAHDSSLMSLFSFDSEFLIQPGLLILALLVKVAIDLIVGNKKSEQAT